MELFGYEIKKRLDNTTPEAEKKDLKSFVQKYDDEGIQTVAGCVRVEGLGR